MAIRTALWKVSFTPQVLVDAQLPSEKLLETMIVAAPVVLSDLVAEFLSISDDDKLKPLLPRDWSRYCNHHFRIEGLK